MKTSIILGLLCMLFSEVAAQTSCYQCGFAPPKVCSTTATCSGSCASTTLYTYISGTKEDEQTAQTCLPADQCISGSLNFGAARVTTSTECCTTSNCNTNIRVPEKNSNSANGKKCFTCVGTDCGKQLACLGTEDSCVKATVDDGSQKVTMKGCISSHFCANLPSQLRATTTSVNCCKGDLCNSAKVVGQSVLLLLGSLLSVLLFH